MTFAVSYRGGLLVVARSPLRRGSEPRLQEFPDLTFRRKAVEPCLAEDLLPVDEHLETAFAACLQLDSIEQWRPSIHELLSQAHGLVEVVSRDAEFDRDTGFRCGHPTASTLRTLAGKELFPNEQTEPRRRAGGGVRVRHSHARDGGRARADRAEACQRGPQRGGHAGGRALEGASGSLTPKEHASSAAPAPGGTEGPV